MWEWLLRPAWSLQRKAVFIVLSTLTHILYLSVCNFVKNIVADLFLIKSALY